MITIPKVGKVCEVPVNVLQAIEKCYTEHREKFVKLTVILNHYVLFLQKSETAEWLIDDADTNIIKDFINSTFSSAIDCRLHIWKNQPKINDPNAHDYPRVFIPVTNNSCQYKVLDSENKIHSLNFKIGYCYIFDVRHKHFVQNFNPSENRLICCFKFDPNKETIYKGL
jgi:hypothetical protein